MIPELGQYTLILALGLALIQLIVPGRGLALHSQAYLKVSQYTALGQFFFVGCSCAALAYALLMNDFSVTYVANNSNRYLPAIYRFCALWGAHEGSMLLWVFILTIWSLAVSVLNRDITLEMRVRVLMVLSLIAVGFYLFILITSNPFARLLPDFPSNGRDLNSILQDPGLVIHPPMLYMGYVGFAVTFAFAIAALLEGKMDSRSWARQVRPFALLAWCFLTLGIVLGSAWAYRELGWGGWWFWDPVENASFLPWLVGTALIHSLIVTEKRGLFCAWTLFLAICSFSLSLLGTFLVRSGVLISVHAFAADPNRGLFMLVFLLIIVGSSFSLFAWRGMQLKSNLSYFTLASREALLLTNNILLFIAMLTVLLGTLYPLFMDVLHLQKISVGAPYFNRVFVPIMIPVLLLMGIAPQLNWQETDWKKISKYFICTLGLSLLAAFLLPLFMREAFNVRVMFGLVLAFWLICHLVTYSLPNIKANGWWVFSWRGYNWGMVLAHAGIAVTTLGIVLSTAYSQEQNVRMQIGDKVTIGAYEFELASTHLFRAPNYYGTQAVVRIYKNHHLWHVLYPEQRIFPISQTDMSKAAIDASIFRDLYVALGEQLPNNAWAVRIYYKPFIRWIWAGGMMMILGGLAASIYRRNKKLNNLNAIL